jgi:hypothetical protein
MRSASMLSRKFVEAFHGGGWAALWEGHSVPCSDWAGRRGRTAPLRPRPRMRQGENFQKSYLRQGVRESGNLRHRVQQTLLRAPSRLPLHEEAGRRRPVHASEAQL